MINADTLQLTHELQALLPELDEFKSAWRALSTIAPERLKAMRHVATVDSIGSFTRIEGAKLTDRAFWKSRRTGRCRLCPRDGNGVSGLVGDSTQKHRLSTKVEREKGALASLSGLAVQILDYVRNQGRVTTRDMVREHGASPNTLESTFGLLVNRGLLLHHGAGRSTCYGVP